jgi:hypothetical protein
MKNNIQTVLFLCLGLISFLGCGKKLPNNETDKNEFLSISPEMLISFAGKNWNDISSQFVYKKDYLYTTPTNPSGTRAVISVSARDLNAPALNYKVTINLDLQNIVSIVHLDCTDTLDIKTGNKVFLYYYDHAFSKMENIYYKWATYNYEQQPPITVEALLDKVRNLTCLQPVLFFKSTKLEEGASYSEKNHLFTFNVSPL